MTVSTAKPAAGAGTVSVGDRTVNRLGYGAMRLTGEGIWGDPADPEGAVQLLRRAVELGVNFIDTANSYGPYVADELIRKALHPYPADLVIGTKAGLLRPGPGEWVPFARPDYLRQEVELSLRRFGVDRIDLFQLHRVDSAYPLADQLGVLAELRAEGKIRHIGLSEVDVPTLEAAQQIVPIVSVQNLYNLANRQSEDVLNYAERNGITFIPWFPIATGELARPGSVLDAAAKEHEATPGQLALAWLLRRSPVMLPIPGTKSIAHLEENVAAAAIELTDDEFVKLSALA